MADKIIVNYLDDSGEVVPIRAIDNEDGTFSIQATVSGTLNKKIVNFIDDSGETVPIRVVDNGDGTNSIYAVNISL